MNSKFTAINQMVLQGSSELVADSGFPAWGYASTQMGCTKVLFGNILPKTA